MDRKTHGRSAYIKRGCRCEICVSAQRGYYQANKEARKAYARRYYRQNHEKCIGDMRAYRSANPERFKHNTPERALRHRDVQRTRRTRLRDSGQSVDYAAVFERDSYTCQLCGIHCPPDAKWPAKNFASLDHIVPISKGGQHTYENTQCLCLSCNLSKGANYEEPAT